MNVKLQKIQRASLPSGVLPKSDGRFVVWWYGPVVCQRSQAPSIPKVRVFFRNLLNNGDFGNLFHVDVGITHLGLLRLGSVWRDGVREDQIEYEQKEVTVSFDDGDFRVVSPFKVKQAETRHLIPMGEYQLPYSSDHNFLLDLPVRGGGRLLIPCMEFFTRMYGRSAEVRRVLAAYPWTEAEKQLYLPIDDGSAPPGTWPIRLAKRVYNTDAVFLAHVRHDPYAREAAKRIYAQIEAACGISSPFAFLKVTPWHIGDVSLIVDGKHLPDGSFLGLRIQGFSDPGGLTVARDRENSNLIDPDSQGEAHEDAGRSSRITISRTVPDIVNLTEEEEPDQRGGTVEIVDEEVVLIGEPRKVIDIGRAHSRGGAKIVRHSTGGGTYSTGERYGTGKGVGRASIHAEIALESQGHLRDIWDAALWLRQHCPNDIKGVHWFTLEGGFQDSSDPRLIPLVPVKRQGSESAVKTEKKRTKAEYRWAFYDPAKRIPRGILVIRLLVQGRDVYLVEIQRREKGESFSGLVFSLDNAHDLRSWITTFMEVIQPKNGVISKIVARCPGKAAAYRHDSSGDGPIMKRAVQNGLKKAGVAMPTPTTMEQSGRTNQSLSGILCSRHDM